MPDPDAGGRTIQSLIDSGAIVGHKDGNHGSEYPRVEEFGAVGVPFLTAKSLIGGNVDLDSAPRLSPAKADRLRHGFVETGDVLLSHNATVGRVAVLPEVAERVLIGTSLTYFRVDPNQLSARYLAAYFSGTDFQNQLKSVMSQTTRNQVPITAQRRLRVVVPALETQMAIATVLGALDDKIELNRRRNQTLEAIARAIFKSWFVDFDPVKAKAAVRREHPDWTDEQVSRIACANFKPEIAALFPDSFEDLRAGRVPTGWAFGRIRDLCVRIENGGTPKREVEEFWAPAEVRWLTSGEVRQSFVIETDTRISKRGFDASSTKMWPAFTTVVARTAPPQGSRHY